MNTTKPDLSKYFNQFSAVVTKTTGKPGAFVMATFTIVIWAALGPIFGFSDTWQLVINTGTTIITFLMVFVIQHSQNKDTIALQLKLNELIASNSKASNRLISIEELTDKEIETIKKFYSQLAELSRKEKTLFKTHSLDEAEDNHEEKTKKFTASKSKK
ncbi:MAG: low affinity iron permease family protein [Ginsengibacter sp.]